MIPGLLLVATALAGDTYAIDTTHSGVLFKAHHFEAGYTFGRFNDFDGAFETEGQELTSITVTVQAESVDSGHLKRDKHLRNADFLSASEFPEITFASKSVEKKSEGVYTVTGDLTLHGVTQELSVDLHHTGEGKDPWGGYRQGWEGSFAINMPDHGIHYDGIGDEITLIVAFEGKRK